jgi:hypothetical protein
MKEAIAEAVRGIAASLSVVDVDSREELIRDFGEEVPVLFVDGAKFAKYRVDPRRLREKLKRGMSRPAAGPPS